MKKLYSQGGGKKNVVYPLDTYQEVKNTYFDRIDTRLAGKLRIFYPPLDYTVWIPYYLTYKVPPINATVIGTSATSAH